MHMACLAWRDIYNHHKLLLDFGVGMNSDTNDKPRYLLFLILKSMFIYILLIGRLVKHKT